MAGPGPASKTRIDGNPAPASNASSAVSSHSTSSTPPNWPRIVSTATSGAGTTAVVTEYPKTETCHEVTPLVDSGPSGLNIGNTSMPTLVGVYAMTSAVSGVPVASSVVTSATWYPDGCKGCTTCMDNPSPNSIL